MRSSTPRWLALSGAALLVVVVLLAATLPAGDYLYVPNGAHPVAGNVSVQGKHDRGGPGGIYYVDVTVRKVRWLERVLPFLRPDGASLVPSQAVTAPGETFKQRIAEARVEMNRSEQVAAAVALRAGGLDVRTTPRGVLVEAVAVDVPAAKVLEGGDVIVAAAGKPHPHHCPTPRRDRVGPPWGRPQAAPAPRREDARADGRDRRCSGRQGEGDHRDPCGRRRRGSAFH